MAQVEQCAPNPHEDVHAWHADLDDASAAIDASWTVLSPDERDRASRFVFERDRRRFVTARAMLRRILGARLGVEPADVRFAYGERGKPFLPGPHDADRLGFNVAHSHGHALFVVAPGIELGADIEVVRAVPNLLAIAERFFSPVERAQLLALPAAQRDQAFFLCWTRKEAYVKALGIGLSHPLEAFSVSLAPGEPARLLEDHQVEPSVSCTLEDLSRLPTYAAAIAVLAEPARIRIHFSEMDATA